MTAGAGSVVVSMLLISSSSPATMSVSWPSAPFIRTMRRFCTLRHPTATITRKMPSPRRMAIKLAEESVMRLFVLSISTPALQRVNGEEVSARALRRCPGYVVQCTEGASAERKAPPGEGRGFRYPNLRSEP